MIQMAVGEPHLGEGQAAIGQRSTQLRRFPAGIDQDGLHAIRVVEQRAVLLEGRDRDDFEFEHDLHVVREASGGKSLLPRKLRR